MTTTADGPTVAELLARNSEVMADLQSVQITTTFNRRNLDPSDPTAPAELEVVTNTYVYTHKGDAFGTAHAHTGSI